MINAKHLHIVSFTVPYPVDYGGVYDLFFKIRALNQAGVRLHLHCFTTGKTAPELSNYCDSVHYYKRNVGLAGMSWKLPYIVKTRLSEELDRNLKKDDFPILIEGVHSSGFLLQDGFRNRNIALRLHNVEHIYYDCLKATTRSFVKRIYYRNESCSLLEYERWLLPKVSRVFCVSLQDKKYCEERFKLQNTSLLPVFCKFPLDLLSGTGCFCLYHGNLSVDENEAAVFWLMQQVFSTIDVPLIIAGKNPSRHLQRKVATHSNVSLVADPSEQVLHDLIQKAQCHVLPSANQTGIKLKLIHALHSGRHCIVNRAAVEGSALSELCVVADDAWSFAQAVWDHYRVPFTDEDIEKRKLTLQRIFDEDCQTTELIQWLS
jgi:hypothetical protein